MTVLPAVRGAGLLLVALLAGYVGSLESQSRSARSSVTVFSGLATGAQGPTGFWLASSPDLSWVAYRPQPPGVPGWSDRHGLIPVGTCR
jgi:hypothetical protein